MSVTTNRLPGVKPSSSGKPRLLFFHTTTSGRSRRAAAYLAQILQRRHNHDTFEMTRIDIEAQPDVAAGLRVTSVPTLLVVEGRRVQARLEIVTGTKKLEAFLAPWLR